MDGYATYDEATRRRAAAKEERPLCTIWQTHYSDGVILLKRFGHDATGISWPHLGQSITPFHPCSNS